jgi:hypothetical protein
MQAPPRFLSTPLARDLLASASAQAAYGPPSSSLSMIANSVRSIDVVESLLRRGSITREMAITADRFREAFRIAHLDTL